MTNVNSRETSGETIATQGRYDRQAGFFDLLEAPVEWAAFRALRRRLWSEVHGDVVLEVGVGTGKNLAYHPRGVRSVVVDLSPRMLDRAAARASRVDRRIDLVLADAQHLPFRDDVFDAAAATFVFCSVPDPVVALGEVNRVLRGGGDLHLLEHVRAGNRILGRIMDFVNPIAVRLSGANINRETVSNVERARLRIASVASHGFGIIKVIRAQASERVTQASLPGVIEEVA